MSRNHDVPQPSIEVEFQCLSIRFPTSSRLFIALLSRIVTTILVLLRSLQFLPRRLLQTRLTFWIPTTSRQERTSLDAIVVSFASNLPFSSRLVQHSASPACSPLSSTSRQPRLPYSIMPTISADNPNFSNYLIPSSALCPSTGLLALTPRMQTIGVLFL